MSTIKAVTLLGVLLALVASSACSAPARPLPAHSNGHGCRGVGLDTAVAGDPNDPQLAWLTDARGQRTDVLWPAGYTARFTPELEVLDEGGNVALRAGDQVTSACVASDESLYLVEPLSE